MDTSLSGTSMLDGPGTSRCSQNLFGLFVPSVGDGLSELVLHVNTAMKGSILY